LALTVTRLLRDYGVVEKFLEFFGEGMKKLNIPDRATIANMTPEYGATLGFIPVDEKTIDYLRLTGRKEQAELAEAYTKANALFYTGEETPEYSDVIELDLGTVEPCVAGPSRPHDRIPLPELKSRFAGIIGRDYDREKEMTRITDFQDESGNQATRLPRSFPLEGDTYDIEVNGQPVMLRNGSVVIASITSCTNTSNPFALIGAGLLAKKAVERGLKVPPFVKTSLAPGSKVVIQYLADAGLMPYLEALGFHVVGCGCLTCIGNSGPLNPAVEQCIVDNGLNVAAVLSANRNFEARVHQLIKSNFIASPMLVVAHALAGHVDIDMAFEPVGLDPNGAPVYLADIWPSDEEIAEQVKAHVKQEFFELEYGRIFDGDEFWNALPDIQSVTYQWDEQSTYIKNPPYFDDFSIKCPPVEDIAQARALALLGDTVTTDHISPAGSIPEAYPAGQYLRSKGVDPELFNSYGSRRGNHEVMMRGTFGNIRLKNLLVDGKEGSFTLKYPEGEERFIYDAAMAYQAEKIPMVILAGKEYGTGSSRDWAAKGTGLLGVRAVIAESFERIHRSNLVGMGVLPLAFDTGENAGSLGLDGSESFTIQGLAAIMPRQRLTVTAEKPDGSKIDFQVTARLDTDVEVAYFKNGGILPCVLRKIIA
jgi:aconitate hydratase